MGVPALRRCVLGGLLVVCAQVTALTAQGPADWRAAGVASFDAAWARIDETYYDPTFGGLDWPAVRDRLRPRVETADSPDTQRAIIREMLDVLRESHFGLISTADPEIQLGPWVVRIAVRATADGLFVTDVEPGSTAEGAGIRPGFRVIRIDHERFEPMTGRAEALRVDRVRMWERGHRALRGGMGTAAELDIEGRIVRVQRERPSGEAVTLGTLPALVTTLDVRLLETARGRRVAVIGFNIWMPAVAQRFATAVDDHRQSDGLVIDLRGNPGGLAEMMRGVAGHFLDEPALLGRMRTRHGTLEFRANPRRSTEDGRTVAPFAGPLAILVDELTASASECFAAGLQSLGRARVFGTPSMGQALPAATYLLPNGDTLLHVVGDFVTSRGQRIEGDGVIPDDVVALSVAALREGRDAVLERAVQWIEAERARSSQ